jgi:hypothetical protein
MPVRKVAGGYQWGKSGKVYPTRAQALSQGRAIYASEYANGGIAELDAWEPKVSNRRDLTSEQYNRMVEAG